MSNCSNDNKQESDSPFVREQLLVKLLMTFIATGLFFMLLPGTYLGVWNLFAISGDHSASAVSTGWIQAHGHAQLFGWVGTFILGIGFYSIPDLRKVASRRYQEGWICWLLWSFGVALRWFTNVYQWQWQLLLPVSATLELMAYAIFFYSSVKGHQRQPQAKVPKKSGPAIWAILVLLGTVGFLLALSLNLWQAVNSSLHFSSPTFPADIDRRFLFISTWGAIIPISWGLSAHWLPALLGLQKSREPELTLALMAITGATIFAALNAGVAASICSMLATLSFIRGVRLFERSTDLAKTAGIHRAFPTFVRLAYLWLMVASMLQLWACFDAMPSGITGASRHALTVGFMATLIFCIGPRMLPAFMGRKQLFSSKLMFLSLALLSAGCFLRVITQITAYQHYGDWGWSLLPVSAVIEMLAITIFALNMLATIRQPPSISESHQVLAR